MKVTLMNVEAQRLLGALRSIDSNETVRLSGMTRLDIARNINRLMPAVIVFEKAVGALQRNLVQKPESADANKALAAEITSVSEAPEEHELIALEHTALRLDDNQRITGDMIAALAPILKDFDTVAEV